MDFEAFIDGYLRIDMFLSTHTGRRRSVQYRSYSDEILIACYKENQDTELIAALFHRYTHLVYGICLRYLHNSDLCKDAVMEIFESLFEKLLVYEVVSFKQWLYTVTRNYCLMALRKKAVREKIMRNLQGIADDRETDADKEAVHAGHERNVGQMLKRAMDALGADQHVCLRLLYLEQRSYSDISHITGLTMKQVKSHVQNGRRNLKNHMRWHDEANGT